MSNKAKFAIAENNIRKYFKKEVKNIFKLTDLQTIYDDKFIEWDLPAYLTFNKFLQRLIASGIIKEEAISFEGYFSDKTIYLKQNENIDIFELAVSLLKKSYLSHYTAVFLHGLTNQVPKTVYLTFEQARKTKHPNTLTQSSIDTAFSKPQRISKTFTEYGGFKLLIHNGMFTDRVGSYYYQDKVPITNIERTLIDIAVRPIYAGGVFSVMEIYRNAREKISISRLVSLLKKMDFIYPYHQVIGFYLEKSGYDKTKYNQLSEYSMEFDFYLTNQISEKAYSKKWKLYYPKGL